MPRRLNRITDYNNDPKTEFSSVGRLYNPGYSPVDYYSAIRGVLVPKQMGAHKLDMERAFTFQFNPPEIDMSKASNWYVRDTAGFDFNDYIWINGGVKSFPLKLWVDSTAGSYTSYFDKPSPDDATVPGRMQDFAPRGVLPQCELLESFTHPEVPSADDKNTFPIPKFSRGGIIPPNQFYAPPVLTFVYGQGFYLEGIIQDLKFSYSTFRKDLVPQRCEIDLVFHVFEQQEVKIALNLIPSAPIDQIVEPKSDVA